MLERKKVGKFGKKECEKQDTEPTNSQTIFQFFPKLSDCVQKTLEIVSSKDKHAILSIHESGIGGCSHNVWGCRRVCGRGGSGASIASLVFPSYQPRRIHQIDRPGIKIVGESRRNEEFACQQ
jgi:hypothetical protein